MVITIPTTAVGSGLGPSSPIPAHAATVVCDGSNYTVRSGIDQELSMTSDAVFVQKTDLYPENRSYLTDASDHPVFLRVAYPQYSCSPNDLFSDGTLRPNGGTITKVYFHKKIKPSEAYLRYYVRFAPNFQWRSTGKLGFGFWGGSGNTGGNVPDGLDGFTYRVNWNATGQLHAYCYHYGMPNIWGEGSAWGKSAPLSVGVWHKVEIFMRLNSPGQADGICKLTVNDAIVCNKIDLIWMLTPSILIDGYFLSTFFGGNSSTEKGDIYSTQVDTYIDHAEVVIGFRDAGL